MLFALCSLLFAINAGVAQPTNPPEPPLIALFPFENLTDDQNAFIQIMPVLKSQLERKGLDILDEDSLNKFLLKERVRSTGYISKDLARKIGEELNVKAILVGSINSFYPKDNPRVGLLARLVNSSDGTILWAEHASATGEDFTTILGLGTIKTIDGLIPVVVERLLSSFTTTPPLKEKESTYRIAVVPFQNKSKYRDAGIIATYMFLVELFKNKGFEPLEYGEVRQLTVDLRIRYRGELDHRSVGALSGSLDVDRIVVGTVELYADGLDTSFPPKVAISARLIDARKNKILQYNSHQLNGNKDIILFEWGKIRSLDNVAYKVVSNLVKKMETGKWH